MQDTDSAPAQEDGPLGPGGHAAAGEPVHDGPMRLQLCGDVILIHEEVAEVAEEVVKDIGLVALAQSVQVNG